MVEAATNDESHSEGNVQKSGGSRKRGKAEGRKSEQAGTEENRLLLGASENRHVVILSTAKNRLKLRRSFISKTTLGIFRSAQNDRSV